MDVLSGRFIVRARDRVRSQAFYRDVLGLAVHREFGDPAAPAAVITGPPQETAVVRSVQLVGLTPTLALLVVVLSNGAVEKATVELRGDGIDSTEADLAAAQAQLANIQAMRVQQEANIAAASDAVEASEADLERDAAEAKRQRELLATGIAGTRQLVERADASNRSTTANRLRAQAQLTREDTRHSEEALARYGNLSSPFVLFVLQAALAEREPDGWWWMSSYGAGFSCHGALLRVSGACAPS